MALTDVWVMSHDGVLYRADRIVNIFDDQGMLSISVDGIDGHANLGEVKHRSEDDKTEVLVEFAERLTQAVAEVGTGDEASAMIISVQDGVLWDRLASE